MTLLIRSSIFDFISIGILVQGKRSEKGEVLEKSHQVKFVGTYVLAKYVTWETNTFAYTQWWRLLGHWRDTAVITSSHCMFLNAQAMHEQHANIAA